MDESARGREGGGEKGRIDSDAPVHTLLLTQSSFGGEDYRKAGKESKLKGKVSSWGMRALWGIIGTD